MSELQRQSIAAWIDERRRNNTSYGITPRNDAAESPRDFTASVPAGTSMVQTDAGDIIPMPGVDHAATERKNAEPENIDGGADLTNPAARNLYQQTADPGRIVPPSGNFGSVDDNHLFAPQPGITEAVRSITPKDILENQLKRWNENDSDENLARVIQTLGTEGGRKVFDEMQGNRADIEQARRELDEEVRKRKPGWDAQYQENRKKNDHWTNTLMGYSGQAAIDDANISREEKDFNLASRLLDAAQYRAETVSRLEQEIAEATGNEKSGSTQRFMHGLKPETLNNLLTAGWGETADLLRVSQIADKAARGEQLTDGEKQAAGAYVLSLDAASRLENLGGATWMEKAGQMIGDNMPFLLEMAITGGFGGAAAGAARGLMRKGIAAGVRAGLRNRAGRYVAKQGANLLGAMVGGAATAPFSNATWGDFAQRNVDQYDISQGVNGEIEAVESRPESLVSRVAKSLGTGTAELGSEYWGGFAGAGRLFPQALRGTRVARITEPLRRLAYTPSVQRLDRYVGNIFKWDGLPMEYAEEQLNNIIGPLMAGEPERIRENFSSEAQLETLLGVVAMGGVFQTIGTGAAAYDHVQSRRRSAGLLGHIQNPDIRQQVARAMGHFTQQQQAKAISNIDWDNASLHDMAATTDYIMHRTQGRVAQEMQRAMQEQQEAKMATLQFEQFKNRDTGQLEEVFDTQGNRFYLAGGTIERSGEETADGTVFVVDPVSGEASQKSIDELKRGQTTSYEEFEAGTLEAIRTVSAAQSEMETLQDIAEEAEATGDNPALRVADYMGIDLSTLTGKTVTLRDGSMAYVGNVSIPQNGTPDIDVVPLDPVTGMTQTGANGEEIHRPLDITEVAAVEGIPVGPETADAQTTPSEGEWTIAQAPELREGQQVTLDDGTQAYLKEQLQPDGSRRLVGVTDGVIDDGEQIDIDPARVVAIDGTPVRTQNTGMENAATGPMGQVGAENTGMVNAPVTEILDENGLPFVTASDGSIDFGYIDADQAKAMGTGIEAPIRLSEGNENYGKIHMDKHLGQINKEGYHSTPEFVEDVLHNFDEIRRGNLRPDASGNMIETFLLVKNGEHGNTVFVELSSDGSYYDVNSGGVFRTTYIKKRELLWKRGETDSDISDEYSGLSSDRRNNSPSDEQTTLRLHNNSLQNKDTNSAPSNQEIPRKKDGTPDYAAMEPNAMFRAIAENFGEDVAREQVAQQISIYEDKIKKLSNSRSENINTRLENLTKIKELQEKVNALREAAGIFEEETAETAPKTKSQTGANEDVQSTTETAQAAPVATDPVRDAENPTEKFRAVGQMVYEMNRASGAAAYVFNKTAELPEDLQDNWEPGDEIDGVTWKGESYICAPLMKDQAQVRRTYIHEVAGHQALGRHLSNREQLALCEAIIEDIGLEHMRSLGIPELNEEIERYEQTDRTDPRETARAVFKLGREYIAYSTERFFTPDMFGGTTEPTFSVDLSKPVTDETVARIIRAANTLYNGRANVTIASNRTSQTGDSVRSAPVAERGNVDGSVRRSGISDPSRQNESGMETSYTAGNIQDGPEVGQASAGGNQRGANPNPRTLSGQDNAGADSNQPGTLSAGGTVTGTAESEISSSTRFRRESAAAAAYEAEIQSIIDQAKANGTYLKAPNGKPTLLSERQWAQVRTRAFKRWFGDWEHSPENASQFVDANGEPKLFYHNTNTEFYSFDPSQNGTNTDAGWLGDGFYFYGDNQEGRGYGSRQLEVFLRVDNPYYATAQEHEELAEANSRERSVSFRETLEDSGYDGVYFNGDLRQEAVVFFPNQIKSATDNTGEFSSDNDDIRFRKTQKPQEESASLIAVHNTTEEQLKKSLELGGFPMPSIAITHAGMGHSAFGEISLLFDRNSIDPANRQNKVYSGDAWTPTVPSVGYKLNEDKTSDIYSRANKVKNLPLFNPVTFHPDNYERNVNGLDTGGLVEHFKDNYDAKQFYLAENGNAVTEYEQHEVEIERIVNGNIDSVRDEVRQILEQHGIGLSQMKPNVVLARVNNTIKAALDYAENGNKKTEIDVDATKQKIDERIDQQRFEVWLNELFNGVVEKKGIRNDRDIFTPSGNSRKWEELYDEVTLDNIVKAMQRQAARGGQGLFGGSIFGAAQKEYPSIDEIRKEAKKVIKNITNDEFEAQKNAITDRLSDVKIPGVGSSFSDIMDMAENIKDAVSQSHTPKGIYRYLKEFYSGMTMEA